MLNYVFFNVCIITMMIRMHACFTCSKLEPICCCGAKPSCGPEPRRWLRTNVLGFVLCSLFCSSDSFRFITPSVLGMHPKNAVVGKNEGRKEWSPWQERGNWIPPCGSGARVVSAVMLALGRRGFIFPNKNLGGLQRAGESAQTHGRCPWPSVWFVRLVSETLEQGKWSIWIRFESSFRTELR